MTSRRSFLAALSALALPWKGRETRFSLGPSFSVLKAFHIEDLPAEDWTFKLKLSPCCIAATDERGAIRPHE